MPTRCWILLLAALAGVGTGCSRAAPKPATGEGTPAAEGAAVAEHPSAFSASSRVEIEVENYTQGGKKSERVVRRDVDGNAVAHGRYTAWHQNGQKAVDGTYFNGALSGVWGEWDEQGKLKSQGSYRDGKKDGRWVTFPESKIRKEEDFRDGVLRAERFFAEDEVGNYSVRVGAWHEWFDPEPDEQTATGSKKAGQPVVSIQEPQRLKSEKHFDQGKEDGVWHVWNAKGQELETRSYKAGQPDGVWKEWHSPGRPKALREFRDGKPHGRETVWFENGQIEEQGDYLDGEKQGTWTTWLPNSQKTKEENYVHGKLHGKITEWYLGEQVWYEGQYDQGDKAGDWITWHKAEGKNPPQKRSVERYRGGKADGVWEYWYPNGQLERHEEYANGRPAGKWKSYYPSGQQLAETDFIDGLPNGPHTRWKEDGQKEAVEFYEKGTLVKVETGGNK